MSREFVYSEAVMGFNFNKDHMQAVFWFQEGLVQMEQSRVYFICGIVTCSSGTHGRVVSYVAEQFGISATVCVPVWVDPSKGSRQYQFSAVIGAVSNRLPIMAPALLTNFWGRSLWRLIGDFSRPVRVRGRQGAPDAILQW